MSSLASESYRLALFDHLPHKQVRAAQEAIDKSAKSSSSVELDPLIHPATIKLAILFEKGVVQSDDERVTTLIAAFGDVIRDYKTPPKKILREDLDKYIGKQVQHLVEARQLSKGMGHLIKFMRRTISKIPPDTNEAEAKASLLHQLQSFLEEKVLFARESIAGYVTSSIRDNDVVLVFGSSPLLQQVLLHAAKERKFKVVVVDARPLNEGLRILAAAQLASNLASVDRTKALNNHRAKMLIDHEMEVESRSPSIECVYTPLSGAATAMKDVTCVVLGASCLLSNGSMLAPAGTAVIAALAKSRHIPVIVAAESYKFSDAVQLDSIVFNELGSSSEIAVGEVVSKNVESSATAAGKQKTANSQTVLNMVPQQFNGYRGTADRTNRISTSTESTDKPTDSTVIKIPLAMPCSSCNQDFTTVSVVNQVKQHTVGSLPYEVVNLRYDLTPIHNISVVATESGLIPPTSVPVLIRELLHSDTSVSADGHDSVE